MTEHHNADGHDPNLAHHFESTEQQFQASKLGMWVFLATEILFFGGLFTAYSVFRSNHPEIFIFGHQFLDKNLGALNTVILICSSLTAAWAVRAAQLKQIGMLKLMIALTMLCAFGFMGVKAVEYNSKWKHGLLWAGKYDPHDEDHAAAEAGAAGTEAPVGGAQEAPDSEVAEGSPSVPPADAERSAISPAAEGPSGLASPSTTGEDEHEVAIEPANAQIYFSIYFLMTGLHGIHVLGGIAAFAWLFVCARRGFFDSGHFTRVDMVALYWHLVDLIWIYLFLLLYLVD